VKGETEERSSAPPPRFLWPHERQYLAAAFEVAGKAPRVTAKLVAIIDRRDDLAV